MKSYKILIALLVATLSAGSAWAHRGHSGGRVGVYVGVPLWGPVWGPGWYPPPYYYPPQVVVVPPSPPPVYIEQNPEPAVPEAQQYWYYCPGAKGYYPYVKECPEGWRKVLPNQEK